MYVACMRELTGGAGPTTMQDVADAVDLLDGVSASVLPTGELQILSDKNGSASKVKVNPGRNGSVNMKGPNGRGGSVSW